MEGIDYNMLVSKLLMLWEIIYDLRSGFSTDIPFITFAKLMKIRRYTLCSVLWPGIVAYETKIN